MSESQIQAITFAFAAILMLTGVALIWDGRLNFLSVTTIFVPSLLLTLIAALGPLRLRDKLLGTREDHREPSRRHFTSETERNVCLVMSDDFSPPVLVRDTKKYLDAANLRPDENRSPEDYLILAHQAWRTLDFEKALVHTFAGLCLPKTDNRVRAALMHRLGTILQTMRPEELAIKQYNEAIKLNPHFSWPHNSLGLTYRYQKNFELADKEFEEAIRLYPENTRPRYNLGVSRMSQKRYPEAEKVFREILQMEPQNYRAHNRIGMIFQEQGKLKEAEDHFREALKIEPTYSKAQKNLVPLLQEMEHRAEAEKKLEEEKRKKEEDFNKRKEEAKKKEEEAKKKKEEPQKGKK